MIRQLLILCYILILPLISWGQDCSPVEDTYPIPYDMSDTFELEVFKVKVGECWVCFNKRAEEKQHGESPH